MKFLKSIIFSIAFCMLLGTLLNTYVEKRESKELSYKETKQKPFIKKSSVLKNNLKFPSID